MSGLPHIATVFSCDATSGGPIILRDFNFDIETNGAPAIRNACSVPFAMVDLFNVNHYEGEGGGDVFWENCAITGVRQRGGRFWGRQVDLELDGTHFEVDGGTAWVFGLKTEGDINGENGFLWAHGGAKVELLVAFNSVGGLKGPAYTIDESDMTLIDIAFNIRKTAEPALATGDNVIVKETGGGVTRLYRNDGSWVKGTGFGLFSGVGEPPHCFVRQSKGWRANK